MGFFKGLKTAVLDYIIPIGLGIINPYLAAAYSGIKTGIETGSPLAGIGSAGLSFGLASATKGLKFPAGGVFADAASSAGTNVVGTAAQEAAKSGATASFMAASSKAAQQGLTSGITSGIQTGVSQGAFANISPEVAKNIGYTGALGSSALNPTNVVGPNIIGNTAGGGMSNVFQVAPNEVLGHSNNYLVDEATRKVISRPLADGTIGQLPSVADTSILGQGKELLTTVKTNAFDKTIGEMNPELLDYLPEMVTNRSPATIAGIGYAVKEMATPPPPPAPVGNMQAPKRDFSKYAYKGPLDRGEYTYADPEDIAYGRTTNYGYLGAKEGGPIKLALGGSAPGAAGSGMMQQGLTDPTIEATKGTFRAPGSIGVVPGKIAQVAQTQPGMMPKPQQMAAMSQPVAPTVPINMPMSRPQAPMNLPMQGQPNMQGMQQQAQQLVNNLPKKDLNVNVSSQLQQALGQLGMAQGGEVPGMAKNTGQQITGQSSGLGSGVYNNPMSEKQFINSFLSIMPNNLVGNAVRELGIGEQVGQQIYQHFNDSNKKQMAQGGEVESNQELQENAFVIPADVVGHVGDGSSDAGAQRLQGYLGMNPQQYQAGGIMAGELQGPGGGMDDLIQTSIEGKRAAAVSPQEFVVPRDIVAELGQGSYDRGSTKLYALMKNVRKEKTGTTKQPAELQRGLGQLMRTAAA